MPQIYKITCLANGKSYVGKTLENFARRYKGERYWAETHNTRLQDDAFKYGSEKMQVEILFEGEVKDSFLRELEQFFIWKYKTQSPFGYNMQATLRAMEHDETETQKLKTAMLNSKIANLEKEIENLKATNNSITSSSDIALIMQEMCKRSLWEAASVFSSNRPYYKQFRDVFLQISSSPKESHEKDRIKEVYHAICTLGADSTFDKASEAFEHLSSEPKERKRMVELLMTAANQNRRSHAKETGNLFKVRIG